jgi:alpha-glucosidase
MVVCKMKKLLIINILLLMFCLVKAQEDNYILKSPNQKITVLVKSHHSITYEVLYEDKNLIYPSAVSFSLISNAGKKSKEGPPKVTHRQVKESVIPVVKEKRAVIPDIYNELVLEFKNNISLVLRAYDDGVAYRFETSLPDSVAIVNELATFSLAPGSTLIYPNVNLRPGADIFHTAFEDPYSVSNFDTLHQDILAYSPVLIHMEGFPKIVITESDVYDYPGMFLSKGTGSSLQGKFAPYPLEEILSGEEFKLKTVTRRADYIAKTTGNRSFPWRVIAIAPNDADLLVNDLVYRLARAPELSSYDWIKPGKSTEEWITGLNLYGVDFEAGLNTKTYKYYIDFASRIGFEYVMLDAGWSDVNDLFEITPGMDMDEITSYAIQKGVGLILWTQAATIERQMKDIIPQFKKWGIKIIMTDFIDRNDQLAIQFMEWFARECANEEFMCMIHGSPIPAGFSRTFPHMLAREGVLGSEYNIWSVNANPEHDLLIPFIRMVAGPMDYEPGILQNATAMHTAKMGFEKVIAQGTRMHQIAMFVVYESPLQLFSGNLSDAYREPELMEFLGRIPTVWDETIILHAKLGKYIVEARRLGEEWFIAAINDWDPVEFDIPLDFLPEGEFNLEIASDGINAGKNPHDYRIDNLKSSRNQLLKIKLAPGGGYVARISK